MKKVNTHKVSIIMGSQSDYSTMKHCKKVLDIIKIKSETSIISAHRTPKRLFKFAENAEKNKYDTRPFLGLPNWFKS